MSGNENKNLSEKGKGLVGEFKTFIARGNVLDLAVGIIVGGAFTAIVTSLVNNILMPIIGVILGGINFSSLSITFKGASIGYGAFIQAVINFLLIALTVFILVKAINTMARRKEEKKEEKEPEKPEENIILLTEIRDLLKEQAEKNK
jgi:large conductance mechanosensitive channel